MAKKSSVKKTRQKTESQQGIAADSALEQPLPFPIVGIGASAGGLEAFENFFTHMVPESGMAFVIVQHLDPTHKSILTDLLKKYTRMPVFQVEDKMAVEPNAVYVIPPNHDMALMNGELRLMEPAKPRGLRLPIDFFFRSLAARQKEQAICIILSGTGADGTLGLKAIKEVGGLTIVQSPDSARYDGMPFSAINTGLVDVVLPPDKIAEQLVDYVQRSFGAEPHHPQKLMPEISGHLQKIFRLLQEQTGHDFSGYKENTISRRIERRMAVNQLTQVKDYLNYLQHTPLEVKILFRELLIGVTSFFRDPEAFEHLEKKAIIPLFAQLKGKSRQLRVWVPGCATGEEAYSVAMLVHEQVERLEQDVDVQIFATDIDQMAIDKAREARYPDSIAADVSPERLQKFFVKESNGNFYRVRSEIREMVVFAVQSVVKDPPFSKLDLICCRNVMIYLGPDLQQKLLSLFHYALNPDSFLFLGNSETLGNSQKYFQTLDTKWKIFKKIEVKADLQTVIELPYTQLVKRDRPPRGIHTDKQVSLKELTESILLDEYTPTGAVVNGKGEVLYIHGRTGKYLEQTTGEVSNNILQMAREGLRMALTTAIRKVNNEKAPHVSDELVVGINGSTIRVKLTVTPITKPAAMQGLMLVVFTDLTPPSPVSDDAKKSSAEDRQNQRILELEDELKSTREYLQTMVEELETTNEELKSAIEELQSSNEELQSTNEELQTSKEELQSVNEELVTVNTELQNKVDELTIANNDIKNLLDNIQVGVIFLDMHLRIRRFTPTIKGIVDLIPADIGRPLAQFVYKLRHDRLVQDARAVLDTLTTKETEVQNENGDWQLMRIMPYYTIDQQVDGVVLTFTDVTQIKQAHAALQVSENKFRSVVECSPDIIFTVDNQFHIQFINRVPAGLEVDGALGTSALDYVQAEYRETVESAIRQVFKTGEATSYEVMARGLNDSAAWYSTRLASMNRGAENEQVMLITQDITERRLIEKALRKSEEKFRAISSNTPDHILMQDINLRYEFVVNPQLGLTEQDMLGKTDYDFLEKDDAETLTKLKKQVLGSGKPIHVEVPLLSLDGKFEYFDGSYIPRFDSAGKVDGLIGYFRNITARKQAEEALRESEEKYRLLFADNPNPMFVFDEETLQFLAVNNAAINHYGWSREEFLSMSVLDVRLTEDRDLAKKIVKQHQDAHEDFIGVIRHSRKDGTVMDMEISASSITFEGRPSRLCSMTDVTERKRVEEELASAARFPAENPSPVLRVSGSGDLIYINNAGIVSFPDWDLVIEQPTPPPLHQITEEALAEQQTKTIEAEQAGRIISLFVVPIIEMGYVNLYGRDITEHKQAENALIESTKLLEDMSRITHTGAWEFDVATGKQIWTDETYEIHDRKRNEYDPNAVEEISRFEPVSNILIDNAFKEAMELGIPYDLDLAMTTVKGNRKWVRATCNPLIESGKVIKLSGTVQDITNRKRAEEALRESEQRYKNLFQNNNSVMLLLDPGTGQIVDANPAACAYYGYGLAELTTMSISDINTLDSEQVSQEMQKGKLQQKNHFFFEHRLKNGEIRNVEVYSGPIVVAGQSLLYSIIHDITERKRAEEALRESEASLKFSQQVAHVGHWTWDTVTNRVTWSDEMHRIFGLDPDNFDGDLSKIIARAIHPDDREKVNASNNAVLTEQKPAPMEYRVVWQDGSVHIVWAEPGEKVVDVDGNILKLSGIVQDITARKEIEQELHDANLQLQTQLSTLNNLQALLRDQAVRDPLTHLYNRRYLNETLPREIARALREEYPLAVLMMDIDHFKVVNDKHGHLVGDDVLKEVANLITTNLRASDIVCRYGGEEILCLLLDTAEDKAQKRAEQLCKEIANLSLEAHPGVHVTVSIGVAILPPHGKDMISVLNAADDALYQAKEAGRNCARVAHISGFE